MPTYIYKHKLGADGCSYHDEFEFSHDMKTKLVACPACEAPVERLIAGSTGVRLLGGGWAKDGYAFTSHPRFNGQNGNKA